MCDTFSLKSITDMLLSFKKSWSSLSVLPSPIAAYMAPKMLQPLLSAFYVISIFMSSFLVPFWLVLEVVPTLLSAFSLTP